MCTHDGPGLHGLSRSTQAPWTRASPSGMANTRIFTASLVAGERSGNLETVLRRYVAYARLVSSVRRRTLSALMYPAVLICLAFVVVNIIVVVAMVMGYGLV